MHVQVHILLMNLFHKKKNLSQRFLYAYMSSNDSRSYYVCYTDYTLDGGNDDFFMKCYQHIYYHFFYGTWCFFPAFKNGFIHICGSWLYMINLGIVTIVIMAMLKCLQTLVLWQCVLGHYTVLLMFSKA